MKDKFLTNPASKEWLSWDSKHIAGYFCGLGFPSFQEILDMRVFDLLNINGLNPARTEEIIFGLYHYLNPNPLVDQALYERAVSQPFDYRAWRRVHRRLDAVKVKDLVLTEQINYKAIQHFYSGILKSFFKSEEYDRKTYRYLDYPDYLKSTKEAV